MWLVLICISMMISDGVMRILANGIRLLWQQWTNTHGLQKSCGEKGMAWPLSKWERGREGQREPKRESLPPPGQAFIAFLGTLHWGWSSFTMHRFTVGDYLLQTTKDRMLLITSKRRMLQLKGESGWTGHTPYLGGLAQTLGSQRYSVNIHCLNPGWGSFSKSKSHSSLGTMQAWFCMENLSVSMGPACQTSLPLAFPSESWATFPTHGTVRYNGEHIFMYHLAICMFSLKKIPIHFFYPFFN